MEKYHSTASFFYHKAAETAKFRKEISSVRRLFLFLLSLKMKISLFAHTSKEGSEDYNQDLSDRRAEVVRTYLLSQGVNPDNLVTVEGKGESEPLEGGTDEDNRRVEIKIENRGYERDESPTSKAAH